jgi:hypothetical protein
MGAKEGNNDKRRACNGDARATATTNQQGTWEEAGGEQDSDAMARVMKMLEKGVEATKEKTTGDQGYDTTKKGNKEGFRAATKRRRRRRRVRRRRDATY